MAPGRSPPAAQPRGRPVPVGLFEEHEAADERINKMLEEVAQPSHLICLLALALWGCCPLLSTCRLSAVGAAHSHCASLRFPSPMPIDPAALSLPLTYSLLPPSLQLTGVPGGAALPAPSGSPPTASHNRRALHRTTSSYDPFPAVCCSHPRYLYFRDKGYAVVVIIHRETQGYAPQNRARGF